MQSQGNGIIWKDEKKVVSFTCFLFKKKRKSELILEISEAEQQPLAGAWIPPMTGDHRQMPCGYLCLQYGSGVAQKSHSLITVN